MRIKKLRLKNFKRFSDLEINLDDNKNSQGPKMVLLIGANGSGKSCIFDAFEVVNKATKTLPQSNGSTASGYFDAKISSKNGGNEFSIDMDFDSSGYFNLLQEGLNTVIYNDKPIGNNSFYGRTAFRYTPKITKITYGSITKISKDEDRPSDFTEYDTRRFENDWETFLQAQFNAFEAGNPNIKSEFINTINQSFSNIFGLDNNISLRYIDFKLPIDGEPLRLLFQKGESKMNYDQLSAGEKMVFEILFNLLARKNLYPKGSVVFLDEVDLHLNTALQENLLKEINENWLEDNQLWLASHSLGFIEYARQSETSAIIDLDNLDFDLPQVIVPKIDNSLDVFDVAVPKQLIFDIFDNKTIILCENKNDVYYNSLGIKNTIFVDVKDKYTVINSVTNDKKYFGLIDRDYLTDQERENAINNKNMNLLILEMYSFENYMYHPDNIEELNLPNWNKQEYIQNITNAKNKNLLKIGGSLSGRKSYSVFKDLSEKEKTGKQLIEQSLYSNNFDEFYKYFDIKQYGKPDLNLTPGKLISTKWFKANIQKVIGN